MIAITLHPPLSSDPDYVIESPAVLDWRQREAIVGGSVLAKYDTLLGLIGPEPGNDALKAALRAEEVITMAMMTRPA